MTDKIKAIQSLKPDAEWVLRGDELEWLDKKQTKPTDSEINEEVKKLQAEYDANEYQRNRKPEYPDIGDQLDDLYKAGAFSDDMTAKIKAVKDKFPK
tara:strand:+ start:1477 stop:1767 length:291 start_codon:yes stop_codon:yes gene_type:complete